MSRKETDLRKASDMADGFLWYERTGLVRRLTNLMAFEQCLLFVKANANARREPRRGGTVTDPDGTSVTVRDGWLSNSKMENITGWRFIPEAP